MQQGSSDIGAFIALQSLDVLLRVTLPARFTTRYSLTILDANNREVLRNSSIRPTDRQISGSISLDLPNNRLGLNIVAYRGGGAWPPFVPAALIVVLTLIATVTLVLLRRHAWHRAETEEQLRAAYAFRQAMSQSLVTGLRAIDLDGRITFVNAAFCRMTGFDESELVGITPPYPYWPPEEFDQLQRNIDAALAGQAPPSGFEMRIMRKNGERFDVRLYFSPLIDTAGQQIGWIASMNDITEPKRARVELERAHERFVTVIDGLDTAVHVADAQPRNPLRQPRLPAHFRLRHRRPRFGAGHRRLPAGRRKRWPSTRRTSTRTTCRAKFSTAKSSTPCPATGITCTNAPSAGSTDAPCASSSPPTSPTASTSTK